MWYSIPSTLPLSCAVLAVARPVLLDPGPRGHFAANLWFLLFLVPPEESAQNEASIIPQLHSKIKSAFRLSTWRLQYSCFWVCYDFLAIGYSTLLKKDLHWNLQVRVLGMSGFRFEGLQ